MATNTYIGPQGGDPSNPANWSLGSIPEAGDTADLFGYAGTPGGATELDLGAGVFAGSTIDISQQNAAPGSYETDSQIYDFAPAVIADTLGSVSSPVAIEVTADGGANGTAGLILGTLHGSIDIAAHQGLLVGASTPGGSIEFDGTVTVGAGGTLANLGLNYFGHYEVPAVTFDDNVLVDGGTLNLLADDVGGAGTVVIADGGTAAFDDYRGSNISVGVSFDATGGTLVADKIGLEVSGTISGFGAGDAIFAYDESRGSYPILGESYANGVLTVQYYEGTDSFAFAGDYTLANFKLTQVAGDIEITYQQAGTDRYTGAQGGNWFDAGNWSLGHAPGTADIAELFGAAGSPSTATLLDLGSQTPLASTIDISEAASGTFADGNDVYAYQPALIAASIGSASAPINIEATSDSGAANDAAVMADTIYGNIVVEAGQTLALDPTPGGSGTIAIDGGITIDQGALLTVPAYTAYGSETVGPDLRLGGTIHVDGGTLNLSIFDSFQTKIEVADLGTIDLSLFRPGPSSFAVTFDASGGTLLGDFAPSSSFLNLELSGFGANDEVFFATPYGSDSPVTGTSYANGTLALTFQNGGEADLTFAGDYTLANFDVTSVGGEVEITYQPCFAAGTAIATPDGARAVETVAAGDRVTLADGSAAQVIWVGHRRARAARLVRFRPGSLGDGVPLRDLVTSDDHAILVDGVLVPARLLVNDATILAERADVTLFHVELERHAVLLAEGAPAESYLDTGNRAQFGNCPMLYDPVQALGEPCAELLLAGPRLAAVRDRLAAVPVLALA